MDIQFATQSYRHETRALSSQRCLNMYAESQPKGAKGPIAVRSSPGLVQFTSLGVGPVRGAHVMAGVPYVVSGNYLYTFSSTGTATQVGGQITGSDIVSMDDNGSEISIANGVNGYIYDATSGFRRVTSTNYHAANTTTFLDGYFVHDRALTNEFFISDSLDGFTYSDYFASAETKSDNILAVLNHLQLLHIFGTDSIEFWNNVGAPNFPFRRQPGAVAARGIAAPHAKAVEDSAVFFLGDDRVAYRLNGTKPEKISTPAIDIAWQKHRTVGDVTAFGYTFEGHKFIVFNFLTQNETWVWDISTNLWHERASFDVNGNDLGRWRGSCSFQAYDKVFIGDRFSGKIGYLDRDVYTEFDNQMIGEMVSPPIHLDGKLVTMPWFELDLRRGQGLTSGQGSNPQVMLSISDDGGHNFDGAELWQTSGAIGAYQTQLRWGPLGQFYERCIRLRFSDPVAWTVIGARTQGMTVESE